MTIIIKEELHLDLHIDLPIETTLVIDTILDQDIDLVLKFGIHTCQVTENANTITHHVLL